jgi:hypothetical protein
MMSAVETFSFSKIINFLVRSKYSGESFFYAAENGNSLLAIKCEYEGFGKFSKISIKVELKIFSGRNRRPPSSPLPWRKIVGTEIRMPTKCGFTIYLHISAMS